MTLENVCEPIELSAFRRLDRTDVAAYLDSPSARERLRLKAFALIGLDAVRDRIADRWDRRREQVWETVQRLIDRTLPAGGFVARVGETEFLVDAGGPPAATAAFAFHRLKEIHEFFLGEARPQDFRIDVVLSAPDGALRTRRLDPLAVEAAPLAKAPSDRPAMASEAPTSNWSSLTFQVGGDHPVDIRFDAASVINLRSGQSVAVRLKPRICAPVADIEVRRPPQMVIDAATVSAVLAACAKRPMGLMASFSFETLSSRKGRAILVEALGRADPSNGCSVIIEITGIGSGTPLSRLVDTVSLIAPYSRATIARVSSADVCPLLAGARLNGVSVVADPAVMAAVAKCRNANRDLGALFFAWGLRRQHSEMAVRAGVTHATWAD